MDYRKFIIESLIAFLKEKSRTYLQKYKKYFVKLHYLIEAAFPELQKPLPPAKLKAAVAEFEANTVEE